MGKFLKALRIAGDCAEIIVAGSILVELYEKFKGRKKISAPVLIDPADAVVPAETQTTENK